MTPVVVVGGGLAGLTVAYTLQKSGVDFLLLEARDRLGGRILTADDDGNATSDGFDLGPSWFWPEMQPAIAQLVSELGLGAFPQHSLGDVVIHRMSREAPQRYHGGRQDIPTMRLTGGSGAIIENLASKLLIGQVRLESVVVEISRSRTECTVTLQTGERIPAQFVVLAMPPRLIEGSMAFTPTMDAGIAEQWRGVPTWMAPHAKFFAVYDKAFWRDQGLSGTAHSMVGPMVEIHDATTSSGKAALFGFLGVSADQRRSMSREAITKACVEQLTILFGKEAASPQATIFKDWASDPFTATTLDRTGGGHPQANQGTWFDDNWNGNLIMAGSETSEIEPGYLAGAVNAGQRAAASVLELLGKVS